MLSRASKKKQKLVSKISHNLIREMKILIVIQTD